MTNFLMFLILVPLAVYVFSFWAKALRAVIKGHKDIGKKISRLHSAATAALREEP